MLPVVLMLLVLLGALLVWKFREDERRERNKRAQRKAHIRRVERRRRLQQRLERRTGSQLTARAMVLKEARRLGTSPTSIEAIEAALQRLAEAAQVAAPSRL